MKKITSVLISVLIVLSLVACGDGNKTAESTTQNITKTTKATTTQQSTTENKRGEDEAFDYSALPDTVAATDGKYEIAFVTDLGQLLDKSFNQGTWEGVKRFAYENKKTYKYYQPANANQATDEDRYDSMKAAAEAGARVIVCAGYLQGEAIKRAAAEYPDVKFIFVDGNVVESNDEEASALENVAAIDFNEEQSGFLAGYAAVADGYTRLGFTGGGGGTNPSCNRFAYGYAQGAERAAREEGKTVELKLSWEYGASFSPSAELQTMLNGWYANGTEIIFCCGGPMCQSVFAAASANEGAVIGVDVDQSEESDTVVTSAMKNLREAVMLTLEYSYQGRWDEIGGELTTLGVKQDAVGLPTKTWSMNQFTIEEYEELYSALRDGSIEVDRDYDNLNQDSFEFVNLIIV